MESLYPKLNRFFFNCLAFFFCLFFVFHNGFGQVDQSSANLFTQSDNLYQWGTISSFHGLPSERVTAISQTNDGVLWFGTERGLAKFDGRRVQTITNLNLSILRINSLRTDSEGTLWIGTETGAFYFVNDIFSPVPETARLSINSIHISKPSVFLTAEKGIVFSCRLTDQKKVQTEVLLRDNLEIKSISQVDEELIVGTHKNGTLRITDGKKSDEANFPRYFVNTFEKDKDGKLWIGTEALGNYSGLYFARNLTDWQRIDAAVGSVLSMDFDSVGDLWVGTKDRGAFQFRGQKQIKRYTFENTSGGLRSNEILATFIDREDVIWLGTDKGICRYDPNSPQNEKISDDSESNYIRTLFQTRNGLIIAGTNRGLFYRDKTDNWQAVGGFERRAVYSISEEDSGKLMVGTSNGFFYNVEPTTGARKELFLNESEKQSFNESVRSIQRFKNKSYLAFFGRGLAEFDKEQISFHYPGNQLQQVISLLGEGDKTLWIGTANNGVFTFDGTSLNQFPALDPLKNIAIWSIAGDSIKGVWFATEKGLFLFKRNELQKVLPETDVDTDVRHVRLLPGSGAGQESVWCATVNGLLQIIPDENFGWIHSRIDVEQGLPSQSTFNVLRQKNENGMDTLFVGTNRGIVRYNLNRVHPLILATRILSKRLHLPSELPGGIYLEYPQNSLAIEVAGLSSRTFPEQFKYTFILKNSQNRIINKKLSNESQFLMENLEAGTYRVEIRAFDKNLTPSEPIIFNFSIADSPFPLTTLALTVLLIFAVIALIWAISSQRRISRASTELAFANRELNSARLDLANEAERERRRISRDLHDQTLADLRHLLLLTDKLPNTEESTEKGTVFRTEIESISNEIRNICEDLSPSVLENIGFTAALEWALSAAVQDSSDIMTYEFFCEENTEEKLTFSPTVQIQIYRIAQEVLSNIVQHSNASHIKMSLEKNSFETFIMKIEDNGIGFDVSKVKSVKGRGLANIQARANLIDAEVFWTNNQAGETIFQLAKS
ncbi:MAG: two-component regulator propeller domain-containing protein [Pyrinomonadaceae bacterium]